MYVCIKVVYHVLVFKSLFFLQIDFSKLNVPSTFLLADLKEDHNRTLVFATEEQLELLRSARHLYIDGTFSVVRRPFLQLYTIHAFVKKNSCSKQVPLMYCLMTSKTTKEYIKVNFP